MKYKIIYTKSAAADIRKLKAVHLADKAKVLINILESDPFQSPPSYEKLLGNLQGAYSRRLNIKHRLVYTVMEEEKIVKIISMWSHYEF